MQARGTCPICKRDDAPIEILKTDNKNWYQGQCMVCGTVVEGSLFLKTESPKVDAKLVQV